jgi:hypothetical protein
MLDIRWTPKLARRTKIWTGPANREAKIALTIGLRLRQA